MPLPPPAAALLEGRPLLVVSPHLDDVVLSCEALVGQAEPLDVLTVCTGRPEQAVREDWDVRAGFADSDAAMTVRLAEDERAFAGTPHRRHLLGLLDRQYLPSDLLDDALGSLGGNPLGGLDGGRPDADAATLTGWVDAWLAEHEGGLVLLPTATGELPWVPGPARPLAVRVVRKAARLGVRVARAVAERVLARRRGPVPEVVVGPGVNGDHRWVRDTLAEHLLAAGAPLGFYEDVPYVYGRPGQAEIDLLTQRHGLATEEVEAVEVRVDRVAKAARVAAYASQVPLLIDKELPLDVPEGLPEIERYWRVLPQR
ncbi:hypothetical protein [Arsenicicoccus sp. oral taxon 190]|uniref:hypothetical protein n=1 Tax=Arsenicicoccus sp. oral taxon 190 TaxID=1658671 RepID=UPI00067CF4A6|nr:hypothetical protein [Arsenicicoccus sp. oral taxon 190]